VPKLPGRRSGPETSETLSTSAATPPHFKTRIASSDVCLQTSRMTVAAFLLTMGSVSFNNRNIFGNTLPATTTCSNYNPHL
jgi:hypothetical protein